MASLAIVQAHNWFYSSCLNHKCKKKKSVFIYDTQSPKINAWVNLFTIDLGLLSVTHYEIASMNRHSFSTEASITKQKKRLLALNTWLGLNNELFKVNWNKEREVWRKRHIVCLVYVRVCVFLPYMYFYRFISSSFSSSVCVSDLFWYVSLC